MPQLINICNQKKNSSQRQNVNHPEKNALDHYIKSKLSCWLLDNAGYATKSAIFPLWKRHFDCEILPVNHSPSVRPRLRQKTSILRTSLSFCGRHFLQNSGPSFILLKILVLIHTMASLIAILSLFEFYLSLKDWHVYILIL